MKDISKIFVPQHDQSDCGVACLASIIKFHGGEHSLESLRKISGTSRKGTTLLGLLQAAREVGLHAEGLEAEGVENLKELKYPTILHVIIENRLQHYLVYYPSSISGRGSVDEVMVGDPAKGILKMRTEELDKIWQSKALLQLTPTEKFEQKPKLQNKKKQWIVGLIKDDFNILITGLFLGIFISVLGISTAIFSQKLIDDILPKENTQKLVLSIVLVALLLLIRSGLNYIRGLFMVRQASGFNNRIIQNFYNNLLALPKSFFDTRKTGELIARMNDTRRIQSVLSAISGSIIIDLLMVFVSLAFVFGYSDTIGFIMLCSLPVYFFILYLFNKSIIKTQKEVMCGYAMAESNFVDTMQGVAEIKLLNKQSFFERWNARVYGSFQQKTVDLGTLNIKFGFISEVVGTIFMVSVFALTSWLVLSKDLKLGEMVALLGMASSVIPAVNRLVIANIQIQEAMVAFNRMFEFTSLEKEESGTDKMLFDEEKISLELRSVAFRFPGRKQILKDISLHVSSGEMVALLGESGGGKSTTIQLIQKFYTPESGEIFINRKNLNNFNIPSWRSMLGCVPQEVKIFNGNLIFNITLSNEDEDHKKAVSFCEETGFGKFFNELPQSYLTLVGEEGINLSGGQKQLVALARALYRKPKLLLLDEATSAMDRNTENFIILLLMQLKAEMTTLLITHRVQTACKCDRVYILDKGVIGKCGSPKELVGSENLYSESMLELEAMKNP